MTNPYFWPGTKIVKSLDNDFNWQQGDSKFMHAIREYARQAKAGAMGGQVTRQFDSAKQGYYTTPVEKPYQKNFTTYSKAVPSRKTQ
jgi:hypothetical protein